MAWLRTPPPRTHLRFNGLRSSQLALLLLSPSLAPAGIVETLDGQRLVGQIHLEATGCLLIVSSNAEQFEITLTNLLRADFSAPTNALPPPSNAGLTPGAIDEDKGALPAPWQSVSIGPMEKRGGAMHYGGSFTVEAYPRAGKGRGEALSFIYQDWHGDGEIVGRVASLRPRDAKPQQAWAGVMMRASLEPQAASVSLSLSGGLGSVFRRWSRKGEKIIDDKRPDLKPPYWVKLSRENGLIAGYQSADGKSWKLVGSSETELPARMLVGLVVLSRRRGVAEATLDHVGLGSAAPRSDFAPRVVLRDGTVIADHFLAMDDTGITFSRDKHSLKVLTADVARLLFQPLFEAASLTPGRTGLLLSNGDFIDGEFRGLERGQVDSLRLDEPLAGAWEIPAPELVEIRRLAMR